MSTLREQGGQAAKLNVVWLKQTTISRVATGKRSASAKSSPNKMTKTIVVRVERRFPHPQFKKVVTAYKKLYAHDEKEQA
jgi:hypothetical protein